MGNRAEIEARIRDLDAAIATITRTLGKAADEAVAGFVEERGCMRVELQALRATLAGSNVVPFRRRE